MPVQVFQSKDKHVIPDLSMNGFLDSFNMNTYCNLFILFSLCNYTMSCRDFPRLSLILNWTSSFVCSFGAFLLEHFY